MWTADDTSADDTSAAEVTEVKKWPITSQDITLSITSQPITEIAGVTVTQGTSTGTLKTAFHSNLVSQLPSVAISTQLKPSLLNICTAKNVSSVLKLFLGFDEQKTTDTTSPTTAVENNSVRYIYVCV